MTRFVTQPNGTPNHTTAAHGGRLLVVEDDDGIAEPLVEGLELQGFEVERAASWWHASGDQPHRRHGRLPDPGPHPRAQARTEVRCLHRRVWYVDGADTGKLRSRRWGDGEDALQR